MENLQLELVVFFVSIAVVYMVGVRKGKNLHRFSFCTTNKDRVIPYYYKKIKMIKWVK